MRSAVNSPASTITSSRSPQPPVLLQKELKLGPQLFTIVPTVTERKALKGRVIRKGLKEAQKLIANAGQQSNAVSLQLMATKTNTGRATPSLSDLWFLVVLGQSEGMCVLPAPCPEPNCAKLQFFGSQILCNKSFPAKLQFFPFECESQ